MIYVVYGISGPLKRVLVDALIYGTGNEKAAKEMINIKGVVRAEKRQYDDFEVEECNTPDELYEKYDKRYIYENEETKFAVNKGQIDASIYSKRDHFIICNDPNVINVLVEDYNELVKLLNITFKNYHRALVYACEKYGDNVNVRRQKIDMFNQKLEESGITFDVDIIVENAQDKKRLPELLWESLQPRIDEKYYNWRVLLNSERFSGKEEDQELVFESDYSKVVNSTAFRRLQDKAQVFPLEQHDYVRTRLTHSIECSTIAEELGIRSLKIIREHKEAGYIEACEKIPSILKTAALLHDMGNPPFGHFGESIIRDWFKENLPKIHAQYNGGMHSLSNILGVGSELEKDLYMFEGNAQLFRLVTKLTVLEEQFGMDLAYATMAATMKYLAKSNAIDETGNAISRKKLGCYFSERPRFEAVQAAVGLAGKRHPLTFLLEAADDISYLTSDLQDAYRKGLISLHCMREEFLIAKNGGACPDNAKLAIQHILELIEGAICNPINRLREVQVLDKICSYLRGIFVEDVIIEFNKNYALIMAGQFERELMVCGETSDVINKIIRKRFLQKYVYNESNIIKSQISASRILRRLLDVFVPASISYDPNNITTNSLYSRIHILLSENYKHICIHENEVITNNNGIPKAEKEKRIVYNKILLATDYICGMTDSFAKETYNIINAVM